MLPGMDPKQMEKAMRQMGIGTKQLNATRVVIEVEGQRLIVNEPQVTEITMQGQKSYQVAGRVTVETALSEEDVKMVMEQAHVDREKAVEALKKSNGDIAEAIVSLQ
jgi:nascent polypeptide-associated complex subunit alpha